MMATLAFGMAIGRPLVGHRHRGLATSGYWRRGGIAERDRDVLDGTCCPSCPSRASRAEPAR